MHRSVIRQRLLIAMGAGGFATTLACGSGDTTASLSDSSMEAALGAQDAPGDTSVAANESGSGEASSRDAAGENVGTHDAAGADTISQADALDASSADAHDATDELPMTVRRPFLVGGSLRQAKAIARNDWGRALPPCVPTLDPRTAHALYRAWRDDGIQEHASIAAFARFTMMLLSVGAPPDLVVDSQRASLDEVAHARACFALARRYGGKNVGPGPLSVADALGPISLEELAVLTAQEGCVGETLGAVLASEQLARAQDPEVTKMLKKLVADEIRHAELAWRFVRWATALGGKPVRLAVDRAVQTSAEEARRGIVMSYDVDVDAWRAHGRLTCSEARAATERGIVEVIEPCLEALTTSRVAA